MQGNKIVAVVIHYYPERSGNVRRIVSDLLAGSRKPDKIIVFNNNPAVLTVGMLRDYPDVSVVDSNTNFTSRAKYGAAMLEPADYYLLCDDDITVGPKTLEALERYATPSMCTAFRGVNLREDSFSRGTDVWPHVVERPTPVDAFIGRMQFLSFQSIVNMLAVEPAVRLDDKKYIYDGEDILIGLCNHPIIYPLRGEELPIDLKENGVSMFGSIPNYLGMRDEFTAKALRVLRSREAGR